MRKILVFMFAFLLLTAGTAMAESIAGRFGLTGRLGATIPLEDDFINGTSDTDAGFSGGGGFIYGITDHLAMDLEVFHMPQLDVEVNGVKAYEASVTDIALGVQFRLNPGGSVVPYIGIGPDFITGDLKHENGNEYNLDWTYGGHLSAGVDWFLNSGIALTADVRGVYAADGDVASGSSEVSEYSPRWIQSTVGVRLILPANF